MDFIDYTCLPVIFVNMAAVKNQTHTLIGLIIERLVSRSPPSPGAGALPSKGLYLKDWLQEFTCPQLQPLLVRTHSWSVWELHPTPITWQRLYCQAHLICSNARLRLGPLLREPSPHPPSPLHQVPPLTTQLLKIINRSNYLYGTFQTIKRLFKVFYKEITKV